MKLEDVLSKLLEKNHMSLSDLSRVTKIQVSTLHGWTNVVNTKNISQLIVKADFFSLSLDYLCFGEVQYNDQMSL